MYRLLEKPEDSSILGNWEKYLWHYDKVIGYTFTGTIFLYSSETNEYLVFYPSKPGSNCKGYGKFDSISEFENEILKDDLFIEYALYPVDSEFIAEARAQLGDLEKDQIYYATLDPALGGSIDINNFSKGNIWVRTDVLGQNRGV